jgi:hypothetical protein
MPFYNAQQISAARILAALINQNSPPGALTVTYNHVLDMINFLIAELDNQCSTKKTPCSLSLASALQEISDRSPDTPPDAAA